MTSEEHKQNIGKITNSTLPPEQKILELEKYVKEAKKQEEQDKKDQQKQLDKMFADEAKAEADKTAKGTPQKVEVVGAEQIIIKGKDGLNGKDSTIPGPVGPKGDKGDSIVGPMGKTGPQGPQGVPGVAGQAGRDGIDGSDGKDAEALEIETVVKAVLKHFKTLKGKERLHVKHIEGLDKFISDAKNTIKTEAVYQSVGRVIGGSNLTAGANITISPAGVISTAAGGTGTGFTFLPATGTVDGVNVTFTFTQKPAYIISDSAWYRENLGWTWNNSILTATLDVPPQSDIFGFV
jgi:hypothetical protein